MEENVLAVSEKRADMTSEQKKKLAAVLTIGAVSGALIGVAGAYLLAKNALKIGEKIEISFGEGARLVVLILGLLRSVATLHEG